MTSLVSSLRLAGNYPVTGRRRVWRPPWSPVLSWTETEADITTPEGYRELSVTGKLNKVTRKAVYRYINGD